LSASDVEKVVFFATGAVCLFRFVLLEIGIIPLYISLNPMHSAHPSNAARFVASGVVPIAIRLLGQEGWARRHAAATLANLAADGMYFRERERELLVAELAYHSESPC
jgi:hypothetical protein